MKKFNLLLILIIVLFAAQAQNGIKKMRSPQSRAHEIVTKQFATCTGPQASSLMFIYTDYFRKYDAAIIAPRPDKTAYENKLKRLKDNLDEKIRSVVTPQQLFIAVNSEVVEP